MRRILALAVALLVVGTAGGAGATLVGNDAAAGGVATQDDTDGTAHTVEAGESIRAAVDDADPGDRIVIRNGTYREHVDLTVRNLTLVGSGNATIAGVRENETVVNVTADGVRIESLTVRGGIGDGVIDEENRSVVKTADGIYVKGADGVTIVEGDGAVVRDNDASANGRPDSQLRARHGIRFTSTSDGLVANNTASDNVAYEPWSESSTDAPAPVEATPTPTPTATATTASGTGSPGDSPTTADGDGGEDGSDGEDGDGADGGSDGADSGAGGGSLGTTSSGSGPGFGPLAAVLALGAALLLGRRANR